MGTVCSIFWGIAKLFSKLLHYGMFLSIIHEDSSFSKALRIIVILFFFYYNHLSGCDMSSMDMKLGKLWEMGRDREAWHAAVQGVMKNWTQLGKWTTIVGGKSVRFGVICHTAMLTRTSVWWGKPLNWKSEDMSSSTIQATYNLIFGKSLILWASFLKFI